MSLLSKAALANPDKSQLGINLEATIAKIREDLLYRGSDRDLTVELRELSKVINDYYDSNYKVCLVDGINAFIYPPQIDRNSPLWNNLAKEFIPEQLEKQGIEELRRPSSSKMVYIDPATGKYQGIAKDVEVTIGLGAGLLFDDKFDIDEVTGILLHEVGHGDTMWRSLGTTAQGNYLLKYVQSVMMSPVEKAKKVELIAKAGKTMDTNLVDNVEAMVDANSEETTRTVVIGATSQRQRSELGCSGYTARGFEVLADAFATLHGYGTPITTALRKFGSYKAMVKGSATRMAVMAGEMFIWAVSIIGTGGVTGVLPPLLIITYDPESEIYDGPQDRAKHIAKTQIEMLKANRNRENSKLVKDIEVSLKISKEYVSNPHWVQLVAESVMPGAKLAKSIRLFQQALEELQSNPLFVKAARLNSL